MTESIRRAGAGAGRVRRVLPDPVKHLLREATQGVGAATSGMRSLPDFLILGAQKSGTTALYTYLLHHPAVAGPSRKEVEYFSRWYPRGERWYRGHFPTDLQRAYTRRKAGVELVVGEASPGYLPHPHAPGRAASLVPHAKLIVLLRDPVDRALSGYAHEVASGRETASFGEAIEREPERVADDLRRMQNDPNVYGEAWRYQTYLTRGLYADQLERWFAVFPQEQFLILSSEEDLFRDPGGTFARVLGFLGVAPFELASYPPVLEREYAPMEPELRRVLAERFSEPNRRLYELVGRNFGWD